MADNRRMSDPMPYLTSDLPGTGGRIRERVEDFVVEEIPLYEPAGVGDHLYVTIQKAGISTHDAIGRLARALRFPAGRVGYAGMKDARAVARQTFSFAGLSPEDVARVSVPGVMILEARRHKNKLRVGHLRGNRFLIRIRHVAPGSDRAAEAVLETLARRGVPNIYGAQRFGSKGDSWLVGRHILRRDWDAAVDVLLGRPGEKEKDERLREARHRYEAGDIEGAYELMPRSFTAERRVLEILLREGTPEQAMRRIPKSVYRILVSSYQSWLFNRLVRDRFPDLGRLEKGDLAFLHDRGAVFLVEDPAAEQSRADALEVSPSAPLFGTKTTLAEGEPGRRERELLAEEDLDLEDFRLPGFRFTGERRPIRVPLGDARVRPEGDDVILVGFSLPRGSYATTVLREIMKN